jgi:hypothetical protein
VRQRAGLPEVVLALPASSVMAPHAGDRTVVLAYAPLTDPKGAPAPGGTMARFLAPPAFVPGDDTQVELGDPNGDGVFGADLGGALIKPGDPMKSYLFLRALSPLAVGPGQTATNVKAPASTEAQMPIANFQYWDVDHDMTALWCWISGMKPDGSNADGPIDYAHCDLAHMPAVVHQDGEATTFSSVYAGILAPSCGGPCHHAGNPYGTTLYMPDPRDTYDTLLGVRGGGPSEHMLGLPYVTRSDPTKSYLYLKLLGSPGIEGEKMPLGGALPQASIDAIQTWIAQGANDD